MPDLTRNTLGHGPDVSSRSPRSSSTSNTDYFSGTTEMGSGTRKSFLTRGQRNQAAFAKAITARCGCSEEGCVDCTNHSLWTQLLDSDSGVTSAEY